MIQLIFLTAAQPVPLEGINYVADHRSQPAGA
jgi:hypothetical protein